MVLRFLQLDEAGMKRLTLYSCVVDETELNLEDLNCAAFSMLNSSILLIKVKII